MWLVERPPVKADVSFFMYPLLPTGTPKRAQCKKRNADAVEANSLKHSQLRKSLGLPVIPKNSITT